MFPASGGYGGRQLVVKLLDMDPYLFSLYGPQGIVLGPQRCAGCECGEGDPDGKRDSGWVCMV
jgi:hypothetical protein